MQRECGRCEAETKRKTQCKNRTCKNANYCWLHSKEKTGLRIKKSKIPGSGDGLYAEKDIKKGEKIDDYKGKIVTTEQYKQTDSGYGLQVTKDLVIDANSSQDCMANRANDCRTVNKRQGHCSGNNAKLTVNKRNKTAKLVATKPIKAGSEIYTSYSRSYWQNVDELFG